MCSEFDVVIAGGGPVGLRLACELALAKVTPVALSKGEYALLLAVLEARRNVRRRVSSCCNPPECTRNPF